MRHLTCVALVLAMAPGVLARQAPVNRSLSAVEKSGEKLFLQRCSLCHMGSAPTYRPYGPALDGFMDARSGERVRQTILEGKPGMPGWQYSLAPAQVDDIMAYMKTLKKRK